MARLRPAELQAHARRTNLELLARAGAEIVRSRRRRRLTQAELGRRVGLSQSTISKLERGFGGSLSLDTWQRVALAMERPLRIELVRDALEEVADAGHLAIQELVVRVARRAGYQARFELPTRPSDPSRSVDVGLRDDSHRRLLLVECWNTFSDLGAATRSTNRKLADAQGLAAVIGGGRLAPRNGSSAVGPHREAGPPEEVGPPYAVSTVWVVRATRRNRALVLR